MCVGGYPQTHTLAALSNSAKCGNLSPTIKILCSCALKQSQQIIPEATCKSTVGEFSNKLAAMFQWGGRLASLRSGKYVKIEGKVEKPSNNTVQLKVKLIVAQARTHPLYSIGKGLYADQ